eukprot:2199304-Prymnesium_polylepis.1
MRWPSSMSSTNLSRSFVSEERLVDVTFVAGLVANCMCRPFDSEERLWLVVHSACPAFRSEERLKIAKVSVRLSLDSEERLRTRPVHLEIRFLHILRSVRADSLNASFSSVASSAAPRLCALQYTLIAW